MQLDPRLVRQQIENLKIQYPALQDDDESWQMSLESETEIMGFLTTIVRRIEDTKALVIGTKDRFEELSARKNRFEHRIEALRELAFKLMSAAEITKAELPEATLSLRNVPALVTITDEAALPDVLCRFERKPDKDKIKKFMADGSVLQGATMSNGSRTISIKIK